MRNKVYVCFHMGVILTLRQVYMHTTMMKCIFLNFSQIVNVPVQRHFEQQNTDEAKAKLRKQKKKKCIKYLGSVVHPVSARFICTNMHPQKIECAHKKFPSLLECLGFCLEV